MVSHSTGFVTGECYYSKLQKSNPCHTIRAGAEPGEMSSIRAERGLKRPRNKYLCLRGITARTASVTSCFQTGKNRVTSG